MSGNLKIRTIVRLRPTLATEANDDGIDIESDTSLAVVNPRDPTQKFKFGFQSVYGPDATQEDIWLRDVEQVVEHVWDGLAVTVFAYGVTSSGKTHTIQGTNSDPGIIPRVVENLFKMREEGDQLSMSYSEIYRDEVYDLIAGGVSAPKLPVREDRDGKVVIQNLTEAPIATAAEFLALFSKATKSRSVGATNLNHASSRSHAILSLNVARVSGDSTITGSINLVDLAGSENNKLTGNDPSRMLESSAINKSLSVLGQVVHALNQGASRIPYRDSKLTRILQDALGGSSIGLLICNLAPGARFRTDTLNTLNFAARTREVENRPVVNEKDNRPVPKPHFAAVQASKPAAAPRPSVQITGPDLASGRSVSDSASLHPRSAGSSRPSSAHSRPSSAHARPSSAHERPSSSGSRPTGRVSLVPAPGPNLRRPTALEEADRRAREREELERRIRDEADKERVRLEAALDSERQARELERERYAARERERALERALEEERANARELLRTREKEISEERDRERAKVEEEAYKKAQMEMDAKLAKFVEDEVSKRFQAEKAGPSPPTPAAVDNPPPPAYDLSEEVRKRIDNLERKYELQQSAVDNLSKHAKKEIARAFLGVARQYFDKGDLETALAFFRRGQGFAPDNAKLQVRIDEIELAIEKQKKGIPFSPVKRRGATNTRAQLPPSDMGNPDILAGHDQDDFEMGLANFRNNRPSSSANTRQQSKLKRVREEALEEVEEVDEEDSMDAIDIDEVGRKKKKRIVGNGKGKGKRMEWTEDEEDENDPPVMMDEDEKLSKRASKSRKGKKVKV